MSLSSHFWTVLGVEWGKVDPEQNDPVGTCSGCVVAAFEKLKKHAL